MPEHIIKLIEQKTGAQSIRFERTLQSLWSGYGSIDRYLLDGADFGSIVVKHVRLPKHQQHPRGWHGESSHKRKIRSYEVETCWYQHYSDNCDDCCRVPQIMGTGRQGDEVIMLLEDLDASGFANRIDIAHKPQMTTCLSWLAALHSRFMGQQPDGLWPVGCYWHLDTRPDELAAMPPGPLKDKAQQLDSVLSAAPYQTLVHGDAKLANFCFSADGKRVAAVDFQYVGGGCGMKDVAYFISSCLDDRQCELLQDELLSIYFGALRKHLARDHPTIDVTAVESSWRPLYEVAWTDFLRFLQGWSPGHWKIHGYSKNIAARVLSQL